MTIKISTGCSVPSVTAKPKRNHLVRIIKLKMHMSNEPDV